MTLADAKSDARKAAFGRRKAVHATGLDAVAQVYLAEYLSQWPDAPLAGYMPILSEIDPLPVMAACTSVVGVPVIQGKGHPLKFRAWTPDAEMVEGPFGAMVPKSGPDIVPEVLIVPLVAFDVAGYRLGYGGGFYDRTLERLRRQGRIRAVGFAYEAQRVAALPREATDQPLDAVVTELGAQTFP